MQYPRFHRLIFPGHQTPSQNLSQLCTFKAYDRFRRLVLEVEDFGGFFRFLAEGFAVEGEGEGDPPPEGDAPTPAAASNSPRRASSSRSAISTLRNVRRK